MDVVSLSKLRSGKASKLARLSCIGYSTGMKFSDADLEEVLFGLVLRRRQKGLSAEQARNTDRLGRAIATAAGHPDLYDNIDSIPRIVTVRVDKDEQIRRLQAKLK